MTERNWAGNHAYGAARIHRPATLDEAREIVAAAPRIRVLGTRHAFNAIADSAELISLAGLPTDVEAGDGTVSFGGHLTYGALAAELAPLGLALPNLASLPHISVAGAVATATHGSGDVSGNLATTVAALELLTSDGELVTVRRGDPDFEGVVVGLGALGAVTRITLEAEPHYEVAQRVYEGLSWDALTGHLAEVVASGDSVSVFTGWGDEAGHVWVKSRAGEDRPDLLGARAATVERHPILGLDPVNCTPQLGVPGGWADRLPHFRMGFTPSHGEELQSELHVPRAAAVEAIGAVRALRARIAPVLLVSELRTIAADTLWMSPQHGRDTLALHFTWQPDPPRVLPVVAALEGALEPLGARPQWGTLFHASAAGTSERLADFTALARRLDPRGAFSNPWLEAHVTRQPSSSPSAGRSSAASNAARSWT